MKIYKIQKEEMNNPKAMVEYWKDKDKALERYYNIIKEAKENPNVASDDDMIYANYRGNFIRKVVSEKVEWTIYGIWKDVNIGIRDLFINLLTFEEIEVI